MGWVRISTKLALGLALTSGLILGAYGARQLLQKEADLRAAARHDLDVLAASVQVAVKNALRDRQLADVREILAELELRDSTLDVLVFDASAHVIAGSPGSEPSIPLARPVVREVAQAGRPLVEFLGPRGLSQAMTALPLRTEDGSSLGVLVVVRPLDRLRRDLVATATSTLLSIAAVFAGLVSVAWLLVLLYVRRPLAGLLDAIRSVRAGDMTVAAAEVREDELGQLAAQFNAMVRDLDQARNNLLAESEARQALEAGLARIDKMVTLGQLSAGLAHEIGSPLQILNGRARALASRDHPAAEVRRIAQILVDQSERITSIVEQLLSFARKRSPRVAETDVVPAIRAVVEFLRSDARRRGLELRFEVGVDIPPIRGDAEQIQQVALNLLTNALRATPRGGRVEVRVSRSSFTPAAAARDEPSVSLTVEDTGAGIAPGAVHRIFEPFFTTWQDAGGTGLGLAVVRSIVDEHGGAIVVTARDEGGTRFAVHFPIRAAALSPRGVIA